MNLQLDVLIATSVGVLAGGLITWLVSYWYYRYATEDLLRETAELRRLHAVTLRLLQTAEANRAPTLTRDQPERHVIAAVAI
jgi:hypothetical protein